jgi:hypothetical protein
MRIEQNVCREERDLELYAALRLWKEAEKTHSENLESRAERIAR